jgi:hypothetical protein
MSKVWSAKLVATNQSPPFPDTRTISAALQLANYMNDVYRCFEIYIMPSETRTYPLFIFDGRNTKWNAENGMVRTKAKMADLLEQRAGRVEEYEMMMKNRKWQCLNGGVIPEEVRGPICFAIRTTLSCDRV